MRLSNLKKEWDQLDKRGLSTLVELIDGQYELISPDPEENNLRLDFNQDFKRHLDFFKKSSIKNELLARAIGFKKASQPWHVLDLTCGLAGDSLLLLSMGLEVTSEERHPLPRLLVQSAFLKFEHGAKERWHLFPEVFDLEKFDAVYFDPMYGDSKTDQKPKKKMRIFREVLGEDLDARKVAEELRVKVRRLVIKRSRQSAPLLENPNISFEGKSTRYDVYFCL